MLLIYMDNINNIIKSLNNKLNVIKSKSNITKQDINIVSNKIKLLRNILKDYEQENRINDFINKAVTTVLKSTVSTVLSTPTSNSASYNMKKKFLAESPEILHIDMNQYPSSYTKHYMDGKNSLFYGGSSKRKNSKKIKRLQNKKYNTKKNI